MCLQQRERLAYERRVRRDQALARQLAAAASPQAHGAPAAMGHAAADGDGGGSRAGAARALAQILPPGLRLRAGVNPQLLLLSLMGRDFTSTDFERLSELDAALPNNGASAAQIAGLPRGPCVLSPDEAREPNEPPQCAVCLEEMPGGCDVIALPCGHRFHAGCIATWLKTKPSCPIDKKEAVDCSSARRAAADATLEDRFSDAGDRASRDEDDEEEGDADDDDAL